MNYKDQYIETKPIDQDSTEIEKFKNLIMAFDNTSESLFSIFFNEKPSFIKEEGDVNKNLELLKTISKKSSFKIEGIFLDENFYIYKLADLCPESSSGLKPVFRVFLDGYKIANFDISYIKDNLNGFYYILIDKTLVNYAFRNEITEENTIETILSKTTIIVSFKGEYIKFEDSFLKSYSKTNIDDHRTEFKIELPKDSNFAFDFLGITKNVSLDEFPAPISQGQINFDIFVKDDSNYKKIVLSPFFINVFLGIAEGDDGRINLTGENNYEIRIVIDDPLNGFDFEKYEEIYIRSRANLKEAYHYNVQSKKFEYNNSESMLTNKDGLFYYSSIKDRKMKLANFNYETFLIENDNFIELVEFIPFFKKEFMFLINNTNFEENYLCFSDILYSNYITGYNIGNKIYIEEYKNGNLKKELLEPEKDSETEKYIFRFPEGIEKANRNILIKYSVDDLDISIIGDKIETADIEITPMNDFCEINNVYKDFDIFSISDGKYDENATRKISFNEKIEEILQLNNIKFRFYKSGDDISENIFKIEKIKEDYGNFSYSLSVSINEEMVQRSYYSGYGSYSANLDYKDSLYKLYKCTIPENIKSNFDRFFLQEFYNTDNTENSSHRTFNLLTNKEKIIREILLENRFSDVLTSSHSLFKYSNEKVEILRNNFSDVIESKIQAFIHYSDKETKYFDIEIEEIWKFSNGEYMPRQSRIIRIRTKGERISDGLYFYLIPNLYYKNIHSIPQSGEFYVRLKSISSKDINPSNFKGVKIYE